MIRILLVNSDEQQGAELASALRSAGIIVSLTSALPSSLGGKFDAVLMDLSRNSEREWSVLDGLFKMTAIDPINPPILCTSRMAPNAGTKLKVELRGARMAFYGG